MTSTYTRQRRQSLTERLQYWGVRDGVVITRQKGVEIGVEFRLPSASQVTQAARQHLAQAVRLIIVQGVPQGCRGRLIIESTPVRDEQMLRVHHADLPDNDLLRCLAQHDARIMEQRRRDGELTCWRYFFTVRLDTNRRRASGGVPFLEAELTQLVRKATAMRTQLVNMFRAAGFDASPLLGQDAFELIWRWFNPGLASARPPLFQSLFQPPNVDPAVLRRDNSRQASTMRRQVTESEIDSSRTDCLIVGDRLVQTVNVQAVGDSTYPGMSERLLGRLSGHHLYYVLDMDHLQQHDERKRLNNAARGAATAVTDASMGTPDAANTAVLDNLTSLLYQLTAAEEHVFRFGLSLVLVARNKAELEHMKEVARTELSMLGGAKGAYGTFANVTQYLDRLAPLNAQDNDFMFRAFSANVAHLIPLVGPWAGSTQPIAVYRSRWGTLSGLNPADGTLNYGTLIVGSAGSGKTFFTQGWLARTASLGADLVIVDQKRDYESLISALEGQFVPFAPGEVVGGQKVRFNAFELPDGETTPDEHHKLFLMAFLSALLGGEELGPIEKAVVSSAIDQAYAAATTRDAQGRVRFETVTLSHFVKALKNLNQIGTESTRDFDEVKTTIRRLSVSLQTYTGTQVLGTFLDGPSTVNLQSPFVYFDIAKIREQPETTRVALLLIIKQIWERAKRDPERPKVAVIEEIGVLFSIPEATAFVAQLYKLGRAYNLWPVGVTQEIADFQRGRGLINNTSQFIIGKVSAEEAATVVDVLGLNDAAHELIRSLSGEKGVYREYLAMTLQERGLSGDVIQYHPNQLEYWTFTSTPAERARRARAVESCGGNTLEAIRALAGLA